MVRIGTVYRGYVPHDSGDGTFHVVYRLNDSIPKEILADWTRTIARYRGDVPKYIRLKMQRHIDETLDLGWGACHMRDPRVAAIVAESLRHFDGDRYHLHAWVVMPNHVHVVLTPLAPHRLPAILQTWKSFTAKEANRILGRTGTFWQRDYFDRAIRSSEHFDACLEYVVRNPVKARLCDRPSDWEFSSAWRHPAENPE